jgi:hypothetical protein
VIDPNETPADVAKRELLQCYRRGWKHGASAQSHDRRFTEHARQDIIRAYQRGYQHGQGASITYAAEECERLQYDPRFSVLRKASPVEPPGSP